MKKYLIAINLFVILCPFLVNASFKEEVKINTCVDGDTAKFIINNEIKRVRFLAIDTPETKHPTKKEEPFGISASEFTCDKLKNATKIELEYDDNSSKTDKYGRLLAWIFVDDKLLQQELVEKGLANVAYLYGDYKYTPVLKSTLEIAKLNKIGIWSNDEIKVPSEEDKFNLEEFVNEKIDSFKDGILKKVSNFVKSFVNSVFNFIKSMVN